MANFFISYQTANSSADYSGALASLRGFYDYQFPSANKGQHQHALLNIAVFHYSTGGLEFARSVSGVPSMVLYLGLTRY